MEYNKVIVPLDGSKLAESVLPHVEKIAKGCAIPQVILVTVTEPVRVKTPKGERLEQLPTWHQSPVLFYGNVMSMGRRARCTGRRCTGTDKGFTGDHWEDGQDRIQLFS